MTASAADLLSCKPGDIAGQLVWDALPDLFGGGMKSELCAAMEQSGTAEWEYFESQGNRWLKLSAAPFVPSGYIVTLSVITPETAASGPFARVRSQLERQVADLRQLHEISARLAAPLKLHAALREILRAALEIHHATMGILSLSDADGKGLRVAVAEGFDSSFLKLSEVVTPGSCTCGLAFLRRERVIIEDVETHPAMEFHRDAARAAGFRAAHSTPLITCEDRLIGVLSIQFPKPHRPSERDERMMDLLARQAADVIESIRLRETAEREAAERLKAQQALRLSEERFRLAAHSESVTLYEQDRNLRYVWLYPSHPEHAGALGKTDLELLPGPEGQALMALKREALESGAARRLEVGTSLPGGKKFYDVFVSPRRNAQGEILGVSGVALDVTASKQTELQQRALYELVAAVNRASAMPEIHEAALDAICRCHHADRASILLYDEQGLMRFRAWRGLSETYRRAAEGHSPWAAGDPDPEVLWINNIAEANLAPELREAAEREGIKALAFVPITNQKQLLGKFMIYYTSTHFFTADEVRPAQTIASQIAFALQRQKSGQALERLVDERTASLREAIAQMEEFSYSVSHDLRAPVRAMQGYARAVLEDHGAQLDDSGRDYLERIVRSGARMDRLIQDILIYSRLSRREIQLQPVSLSKLLREILLQYPQMQAPQAEIELVEPLHDVLAHEPSLSQAVSNLLSNAVKFVLPGQTARVRLAAERRGEWVRFWVEDNGIGIRPEYQHRLFGMFERIHPERKYEGTGIGLAIVRKAVERMGGRVGVVSDGTTGSRFWLELPGASTPAPAP